MIFDRPHHCLAFVGLFGFVLSAASALASGERAVWRWQNDLAIVEAEFGEPTAFANLNSRSDL